MIVTDRTTRYEGDGNVCLQDVNVQIKGVTHSRTAVRVGGQSFIRSGRFLVTAGLEPDGDAWQQDVNNPHAVVTALRNASVRIDLLKFWQRVPDSQPKYDYYHEWCDIAAIPITNFDHWWTKQVNDKTRNMVRKSKKLGVTIAERPLDDEMIRGIMEIFNESPIKRGKPFRHYNKSFETVKREMSNDFENSIFITAYYQQELIGFIKLLVTDRYAMITLILDKRAHRNKSPINGLVAKAVEICADRRIPYITYTVWRKGDHGRFQKHNGFTKIPIPEYYVPLTLKGRLALSLRLHRGITALLPEKTMQWLLALRAKWYLLKYPQASN